MPSEKPLWERVLIEMQKKISAPAFDTWFSKTKCIELEDDVIVIQVPSEFHKEWINTRYYNDLKSVLIDLMGRDLNLKLVVCQTQDTNVKEYNKFTTENDMINEIMFLKKFMITMFDKYDQKIAQLEDEIKELKKNK
jgi:chromosomal replication initiation ATPase DnaA